MVTGPAQLLRAAATEPVVRGNWHRCRQPLRVSGSGAPGVRRLPDASPGDSILLGVPARERALLVVGCRRVLDPIARSQVARRWPDHILDWYQSLRYSAALRGVSPVAAHR